MIRKVYLIWILELFIANRKPHTVTTNVINNIWYEYTNMCEEIISNTVIIGY